MRRLLPSLLVCFAAGSALLAQRAGVTASADRFTPDQYRAWARDFGTPLYVYDGDRVVANYRRIAAAFRALYPATRVHYAIKANSNRAILRLIRREGAGAEVVSEGEIDLALHEGFAGRDILFTSNSKSSSEIDRALAVGAILNVDSRDELEQIARRAGELGKTARISFRLNPAVDPHTHARIATGVVDSKFGLHLADGIAERAVARALELAPQVKLVGLHTHIGSQITSPEPYRMAAEEVLDFVVALHRERGVELEFVDLGGGLGIPYQDGQEVMSADDWAHALVEPLLARRADLGRLPELWIEPGRALVADAGLLLTRVNSVKTTPIQTFVNVDAGFNTLARPLLYDAYHRVRIVGKQGTGPTVTVAGNVCESGDILAKARDLPATAAGDLALFLDAGAYGFSMASEYNSRPLPAEILVRGRRVDLVRSRESFRDLLRNQKLPRDLE
ncbi:MAG: diaminopimelate decarboxylase [Thermoanaerobaculia bacterium]